MADITMCANGDKCPRHSQCYRWTAPRSEFWQAVSAFYKPDQECKEFWDNAGWHHSTPEA